MAGGIARRGVRTEAVLAEVESCWDPPTAPLGVFTQTASELKVLRITVFPQRPRLQGNTVIKEGGEKFKGLAQPRSLDSDPPEKGGHPL